jgi:hypothetical protein
MRSLREHWLELLAGKLRLERLDALEGRADRQRLVLREEALEEAHGAGVNCDETLDELMALDIYCLDPALGLALIPFAHGNQLAWFIFDLFSTQGIPAWQFLGDAPKTRRPLAGISESTALRS